MMQDKRPKGKLVITFSYAFSMHNTKFRGRGGEREKQSTFRLGLATLFENYFLK